MNKNPLRFLMCSLFLCLSFFLFPKSHILLQVDDLKGDSAYKRRVYHAVDYVEFLIDEQFFSDLGIDKKDPDYRIEIRVNQEGNDADIQLELFGGDGETLHRNLFLSAEEELIPVLLPAVYSLWAQSQGFDNQNVPQYLEHYALSGISTQESLGFQMPLMPMDIDITPAGDLLVSCGVFALELEQDFSFRRYIGVDLYRQGNVSFAHKAEITPAGTQMFINNSGAELISLHPGSERAFKSRLGFGVAPNFSIFRDGTVMAVDQGTQKIFRIEGREKTEIIPEGIKLEYIQFGAVSPADDFWLFDSVNGRFLILNREGQVLRSFFPAVTTEMMLSMKKFIPLSDGSVTIFTYNGLYKVDSQGKLLWWMDYDRLSFYAAPYSVMDMTVDEQTGYLYMANYSQSMIYRFKDTTVAPLSSDEQFLIEQNELLALNPNAPDVYRTLAQFYHQKEAFAQAEFYWNEVVQLDPYDFEALDYLESIQLENLVSRAVSSGEEVLALIENLGPESARTRYNQTLQLCEQILSRDPYQSEISRLADLLKQRFIDAEALPQQNQYPLQIVSTTLMPVFPSLLNQYQTEPVGWIRVKNPHEQPVYNVVTNFACRYYSDFAGTSDGSMEIQPNETVDLPLYASFNSNLLTVEEDMPVSVQIGVDFFVDGRQYSQSVGKNILVHRKSALIWDDSAKLASFVTPNEPEISRLSHHLAGIGNRSSGMTGMSAHFSRIVNIFEGARAFEIQYIEDPSSPISRVFDDRQAVDTVRFAKTTLLYRSGDCDDTTVLMMSLFESAGIETAIMTSPGHVFLAVNIGEPKEMAWFYETESLSVIPHEDSLWIPVESTALNEGFAAAWEKGSDLLSRYQGQTEFIPIKDVKSEYPPLPLPTTDTGLLYPLKTRIADSIEAEHATLVSRLFTEKKDALESEARSASGRSRIRTQNSLGILLARYNKKDQARNLFASIVNEFPEYTAAYVNLANLWIEERNYSRALSVLENGKDRNPDSRFIQIMMSRVYTAIGDVQESNQYRDLVQRHNPQLAERFLTQDDQAGRAGETDLEPLWMTEELPE